jgi:hypothetical protein
MADVTPPVGLASFAAAAISGGDPIKTGIVGFFYSLRTAALPFLFIFNTDLLLINVDFLHGAFIFAVATGAMLLFAAATQGWFLVRSRLWESVALLLLAFTFFRPGFWMDMIVPPYIERAPAEIAQAAENAKPGENLRLMIHGTDSVGNKREWMVQLGVGAEKTGAERVAALGLKLRQDGNKVLIDDVGFDSKAKKAGLDWDQEILFVLRPNDQPSKYWMYIPALLLLGGVVLLQRRRAQSPDAAVGAASKA